MHRIDCRRHGLRLVLLGLVAFSMLGCEDSTTGPTSGELVEPLYQPAIGMTWTFNLAIPDSELGDASIRQVERVTGETTIVVAGDSIAVFQIAVSQTWPNSLNIFYYTYRGVDDQGVFSARPDRDDTPGEIYRPFPNTCSDDGEQVAESGIRYSCIDAAADVTVPAGTYTCKLHRSYDDERSPDHYTDFYLAAGIGLVASYVYTRASDELVRVASELVSFEDGQAEEELAAMLTLDEERTLDALDDEALAVHR